MLADLLRECGIPALATYLDVADNTLWRYASGRCPTPPAVAARIAQLAALTPEEREAMGLRRRRPGRRRHVGC